MATCKIRFERDCRYYTWKIPSVSSIPNTIGYVVQCPSFSFGGTSWTLKMYPNGDSQENEGFTSLTIERLETRENVRCSFFYKNIHNKEIGLKTIIFTDSKKEESINRLMKNLKEISQDSDIVIDDTLHLGIALCQDISSESVSHTIGITDRNEHIVGEIFKEYEGGKEFLYIVSDIPRGLPSDYHIESPQFSFLNAKWIFKMRPYHRMENSQKASVDIVLQRLESQVPVHHVKLRIALYYLEDSTKEVKSMSFNSMRVQSPALEFQLNDLDKSELEFLIKIRALKTLRFSFNPEKKSVEKTPATEKLINDLAEMFKCEKYSDVIIRVKDEEFRLHRNILACRSPYFRSMFETEMKEKTTCVVIIDDCEVDIFRNYALFLYTGKVEEMTIDNVCDLYEVAVKYKEDQLKEECLCFIKTKMSVESFCDFIVLALKHDDKELLQNATDLFCRQTKKIIQENVKWRTFMIEYPAQANDLYIKAYDTVVHSLNNDEVMSKKRRMSDNDI